MSVSRISSPYIVDRGVFNIQNNLLLMNKLQEKIASGKNITVPSDDPIGLSRLLRVNREMTQDDRYRQNIDQALGETSAADVAVTGVVNIVQRIRELSVSAANGTNSDTQLNAMNAEIEMLKAQLVQLGNTSFGGKYIFSGFMTDSPPFSVSGMDITYNGSANTPGSFERNVEVARNINVAVNLNGDDLLGNVAVVAGVASGSGLLFDITELQLAMQNKDFTTIRSKIDDISTSLDGILQLQTSLGGRINQLELSKNRIQDRGIVQSQEVASIQDINMAKTISDFNFQQNVYQASLSVMSQVMNTSLVNFLR